MGDSLRQCHQRSLFAYAEFRKRYGITRQLVHPIENLANQSGTPSAVTEDGSFTFTQA